MAHDPPCTVLQLRAWGDIGALLKPSVKPAEWEHRLEIRRWKTALARTGDRVAVCYYATACRVADFDPLRIASRAQTRGSP